MASIQTNRDLYLAIAGLIAEHGSCRRSLAEYLRALWQAGRQRRGQSSLSADEFFALLAGAFTQPAPPFDEAWRARYGEDFTRQTEFAAWEARILRQIVDLDEMARHGMFDDEMRYFGINSPRGSRWYNFDPCTFLECATAGAYGGWEPGDPTSRGFVPGPVAVLGDDGRITECAPEEVPRGHGPILRVSWDDFCTFLGDGQWYE